MGERSKGVGRKIGVLNNPEDERQRFVYEYINIFIVLQYVYSVNIDENDLNNEYIPIYICICSGYTYEPLELEIVFAAIALFAVKELERFFSLPFAEH
jgi:hypothetical protein